MGTPIMSPIGFLMGFFTIEILPGIMRHSKRQINWILTRDTREYNWDDNTNFNGIPIGTPIMIPIGTLIGFLKIDRDYNSHSNTDPNRKFNRESNGILMEI